MCYYEDDEEYALQFGGVFYNYWAVIDPRGLAPEGLKIPTYQDWEQLREAIADSNGANSLDLQARDAWPSDSTDKYGFSALPSGRRYEQTEFDDGGYLARWWSSTEESKEEASATTLDMDEPNSLFGDPCHKGYGLAVRCLRNR